MTTETLKSIKQSLAENSIYRLFESAIGTPEEVENYDKSEYALMFNVDSDELFFLDYATKENRYANTAERQHPWVCIGYVSATEILMEDPSGRIFDELDYKNESENI